MPRPKGSQNKSKTNKMNFAAAMEAKLAEKAQLEQKITEVTPSPKNGHKAG